MIKLLKMYELYFLYLPQCSDFKNWNSEVIKPPSILPRSNHHMIFKFLISFRKTDEDKMA